MCAALAPREALGYAGMTSPYHALHEFWRAGSSANSRKLEAMMCTSFGGRGARGGRRWGVVAGSDAGCSVSARGGGFEWRGIVVGAFACELRDAGYQKLYYYDDA